MSSPACDNLEGKPVSRKAWVPTRHVEEAVVLFWDIRRKLEGIGQRAAPVYEL